MAQNWSLSDASMTGSFWEVRLVCRMTDVMAKAGDSYRSVQVIPQPAPVRPLAPKPAIGLPPNQQAATILKPAVRSTPRCIDRERAGRIWAAKREESARFALLRLGMEPPHLSHIIRELSSLMPASRSTGMRPSVSQPTLSGLNYFRLSRIAAGSPIKSATENWSRWREKASNAPDRAWRS